MAERKGLQVVRAVKIVNTVHVPGTIAFPGDPIYHELKMEADAGSTTVLPYIENVPENVREIVHEESVLPDTSQIPVPDSGKVEKKQRK